MYLFGLAKSPIWLTFLAWTGSNSDWIWYANGWCPRHYECGAIGVDWLILIYWSINLQDIFMLLWCRHNVRVAYRFCSHIFWCTNFVLFVLEKSYWFLLTTSLPVYSLLRAECGHYVLLFVNGQVTWGQCFFHMEKRFWRSFHICFAIRIAP